MKKKTTKRKRTAMIRPLAKITNTPPQTTRWAQTTKIVIQVTTAMRRLRKRASTNSLVSCRLRKTRKNRRGERVVRVGGAVRIRRGSQSKLIISRMITTYFMKTPPSIETRFPRNSLGMWIAWMRVALGPRWISIIPTTPRTSEQNLLTPLSLKQTNSTRSKLFLQRISITSLSSSKTRS